MDTVLNSFEGRGVSIDEYIYEMEHERRPGEQEKKVDFAIPVMIEKPKFNSQLFLTTCAEEMGLEVMDETSKAEWTVRWTTFRLKQPIPYSLLKTLKVVHK